MRKSIVIIVAVIVALGMMTVATGCSGGYAYRSEPVRKGPPPPWAPAHGARAKHRYRYYPGAQVYYDPGRRIYFYISGSTWTSGARLPASISISGTYVHLEMDADMPYVFHDDVKKHHPPGQMKKQHEDDDKEKSKGKGKGKKQR
jgi:hypothetical protein